MTCPIEGCIRGEGIDWGSGPTLCVPHRAEWAADHEAELTPAERKHWVHWFKGKTPHGETFTTWPCNFGQLGQAA
jgi:hypothetical protein